jgi:hypothetical protein
VACRLLLRPEAPARRGRAGAARCHLLLKYPDRDEPENSDFTQGDVLSLPEKGEWRVEEIRAAHDRPNPELVCVPA